MKKFLNICYARKKIKHAVKKDNNDYDYNFDVRILYSSEKIGERIKKDDLEALIKESSDNNKADYAAVQSLIDNALPQRKKKAGGGCCAFIRQCCGSSSPVPGDIEYSVFSLDTSKKQELRSFIRGFEIESGKSTHPEFNYLDKAPLLVLMLDIRDALYRYGIETICDTPFGGVLDDLFNNIAAGKSAETGRTNLNENSLNRDTQHQENRDDAKEEDNAGNDDEDDYEDDDDELEVKIAMGPLNKYGIIPQLSFGDALALESSEHQLIPFEEMAHAVNVANLLSGIITVLSQEIRIEDDELHRVISTDGTTTYLDQLTIDASVLNTVQSMSSYRRLKKFIAKLGVQYYHVGRQMQVATMVILPVLETYLVDLADEADEFTDQYIAAIGLPPSDGVKLTFNLFALHTIIAICFFFLVLLVQVVFGLCGSLTVCTCRRRKTSRAASKLEHYSMMTSNFGYIESRNREFLEILEPKMKAAYLKIKKAESPQKLTVQIPGFESDKKDVGNTLPLVPEKLRSQRVSGQILLSPLGVADNASDDGSDQHIQFEEDYDLQVSGAHADAERKKE